MSDRETIDVYDVHAEDYASRFSSDQPDSTLGTFINDLPVAARVLDLGCGPGTAAGHMAAAGLVVDAMDASAEMVALAAKRPGVTAWQASFDDLDAVDVYDGVWANFSLLHAARDQMPAHLAAIHRALKPKGLLHLGLKQGAGSERDALGRYYTYYEPEEIGALLEPLGRRISNLRFGEDAGLSGQMSKWFTLTAHA